MEELALWMILLSGADWKRAVFVAQSVFSVTGVSRGQLIETSFVLRDEVVVSTESN